MEMVDLTLNDVARLSIKVKGQTLIGSSILEAQHARVINSA